TPEGYVYLVMELLEGRTLRDVLAKEAPLDVARAVSIMLQTAAAVAAAHQAGIIHRDLKPANIFIAQKSDVPAIVKVLDFGIAKLAVDSLEEEEPLALTQVGAMIGTPRYMSPEQCDGLELTPAADVYSLGVILYEMLTGMVPFSGSTPLAIALKHASELPRAPREIVASIPIELEALVLHAMEKRPQNRPGDAAAFRSELLAIAERLGLEHHALTNLPDLELLRGAGVESPSGRLVIDISRLRETLSNSAAASDLTLVSQKPEISVSGNTIQESGGRNDFPRVSISVKRGSFGSQKLLLVLAVAAILVFAVGFLAARLHNTTAGTNVNAVPVPSPTASPSPSPQASPKRQPSPKPSPSPSPEKKKGSKVGSIVNKVKRILKKPF
ncbi:MAG: protein kinase, partial [Pyrinomonadaceae bacterium]